MPVVNYVTTCAPLRLSFAGGGTDLPDFYRRETGAVLSTAIDKRVFVTVKRVSELFNRRYRLNYSESENVDRLDDIKNSIARECLRLVSVDPPLYIATIGDVPASSGLGSSSSFAVGLLQALHVMRNERVSSAEIAKEAAHVEMTLLGRPIGKQDHFAAAFGGLNLILFYPNDQVAIEPLPLPASQMERLFDYVLVFWTGIERDAGEILDEQKQGVPRNFDRLASLRDQAHELRNLLNGDFDPAAFGAALGRGWEIKRGLASTITNDRIDDWYARAMAAGAYGGKICGAGGGGFLMFIAAPERHAPIRRSLGELLELAVGYEPQGVRVINAVVE
ncbi:MAG: GHMP family kinase ATP-binding protein [Pseudomonadota bacterium]